jgi:branched-chain amino acid transport system substrate-binding protein
MSNVRRGLRSGSATPDRAGAWRHKALCGLCLPLVVGVAACGGSSSSSGNSSSAAASTSPAKKVDLTGACDKSQKPFTEAMVVDLSGPTKAIGALQSEGYKAAAKYLNAKSGGIGGRCVEVKTLDSTGDPATASQVLLKYISSGNKPDSLWPGSTSPEVAATMPIVVRNKLFSVGPSTIGDAMLKGAASKYPFQFAIVPPDTNGAAPAASAKWATGVKAKKVGILQLDTAHSATLAQQTADDLKKAGIDSVIKTYPATALDLTPQVSALRDAGADALIQTGTPGPTTGPALNAPQKLGWNVPYLFTDTSSDLTTLAAAAVLKDVKLLAQKGDSYTEADAPAAAKQLVANGGAANSGPIGLAVPGYSWDAAIATALAAKEAGNTDATSLTKGMESLSEPKSPLYVSQPAVGGYTADNHENMAAIEGSWTVIEPRPIQNGLLQ